MNTNLVRPMARDAILPESDYRAPVDQIQSVLCTIWGRALNLDRVGIDDDFFSFGGSSLSAIAILEAVQQEFDVELPLAALVDHSSVLEMADFITATKKPPALPAELVCFQAGERGKRPLFLVHGLLGQIFMAGGILGGLDPSRPVYGIQARGLASRDPLRRSLGHVVRDYLDAVESVVGGERFHLGGFCYGALITLEMANVLGNRHGQAPVPLLIDPPVYPRGHQSKARRFGTIRLALEKMARYDVAMATLQNRLDKRSGYNQLSTGEESRRLEVAARMRHLLTHHVVGQWPGSAFILTSEGRGERIRAEDSFWNRFSNGRFSTHVVAETHHSLFSQDRARMFRCVNQLLVEQENVAAPAFRATP